MSEEKESPANDDVIIEPPSDRLMKKAPPVARSLDVALKKTERVVASIGLAYPERLARDCARLKELSLAFTATLSKETMEDIRFLAHDMKGQGGQFGYDLITAIGDILQKYIKEIGHPVPRTAEIVQVYVDTLLLVESRKMTGNGGEAGQLLLANLGKLVK